MFILMQELAFLAKFVCELDLARATGLDQQNESIVRLQLCLGLVAVTELQHKILKIWQKRVFKQ